MILPSCNHCHVIGLAPDTGGISYCPVCGHNLGEVEIPAPATCPGCTDLGCEQCNVVLPEPMSDQDQCTYFLKDLNALIKRYSAEFNLTYPQVVGALHIVAADLCSEANRKNPPPEDD